MLRILDSDEDIVEIITDEIGYKFDFIGSINMLFINEWCNVLITRLLMEKVINSSCISDIIVVPDKVKKRNKKYKSNSKVVSLQEYYEEINVFSIYVLMNDKGILDEYSFNNLMPLILDCELIEDLFNDYGEYIGSDRDISDFTRI